MKLHHRISLRPASRIPFGVKGLCFALLATLLSLLQPLGAAGQDTSSADENLLEEVQAPAGFDVTLFATPPEINYPTAITATPAGELFVGIDRNGSLDQERGRGQIVRAADQDGDGQADQFISFVDSIDSPRGLSYDGETLYVMHPPELTAYRDVDGDGKADRSRTLISGLGFDLDFRGADHTTNGIKRGIDGWIYVAVGDYGFMKAVGADGTQLKHRGGGIVRVRPDGSEMEIVSTGLRNVYDLAMDPYLNGFVRGNTNDGGGWDVRLNHIVLGADYGYPTLYKNFSDEALPPLADYGGGSGTGALFIQEPGFPDAFNNMLYTSDWGRSKIYRHPLQAEGASFLAKQESFLDIPRPTDLSVDGRSRLYVSSWHEGKFRYAGQNVGYIVQLTPSGNSPAPLPDVKQADADALLDVLASPSQVRRLQAQHEILRRGDDASLASGLKDLASGSAPLYARVAAIFTLKQLQGARSHDFLLQLAEQGGAMREFALRALVDRKSQLAGIPSAPFLAALDASNPRVQQQGVTGLARLGERDAADEILPLTTAPDPVLSHLAAQALVSLQAVQPALDALDSSSPALVAGALQVLKQLHDRQAVEGLIGRLEATSDPAARRPILQALARLYYKEGEWQGNWWGTRPDTRGPYYEPTTWAQSDEIRPVLRKALGQADGDQLAALLNDLERNRVLPGQAASLIANASEASKVLELKLTRALVGQRKLTADLIPLLKEAAERNTDLRASLLQLLTAQEEVLPGSISLLRSAALDGDLAPSLRQQALVSLSEAGGAKGRSAAVQTLALLSRRSELPTELQNAWQQFAMQRQHAENLDAFIQLARDGRQAEQELAYAVLLNIAQTDGIEDEVRQQASQVLSKAWQNNDATVPLLRAIGRLQADGYADKVRARLEEAPSPQVQEAARFAVRQLELEAASPSTGTSSASEQIGNLAYEDVLVSAAEMEGNPQEGRRLFMQQGCQTCHTVKEGEPLKGPHLGGIAERYSRRELAESIMRPNANIAQGFSTHQFEMEDGTRHIGFIIRESSDEVEIGNPVGSVTVLDKDDIASREQQENSMMPSGLVQQLTPQQLASLISYLETTTGSAD